MAMLILDAELEKQAADLFDKCSGGDWQRFVECWDGVTVVAPMWDNEHQDLRCGFGYAAGQAFPDRNTAFVVFGVNVSDRDDWEQNYRCPDVVAYLAGNPAKRCGSHWVGGPDLLVEIISPGEQRDAKLGFYASVNTREVLIIDRNPWQLELFALAGGALVSTGTASLATPAVLTSAALGLTFELIAGPTRPQVRVSHPATGRFWLA